MFAFANAWRVPDRRNCARERHTLVNEGEVGVGFFPPRDAGVPRRDMADVLAMPTPPSRSPAAGGFLIVVGIFAGSIGGLFLGEATAGFLIGAAIGIALAVAIWLRGR